MAVEVTQLLSQKLIRQLSSNPDLKSKADEFVTVLDKLQKSSENAVSVQGSDEQTPVGWSMLLKDFYFLEDMLDEYQGTIILQSHKGFNMMYNPVSINCWLRERRLRNNIGKLKKKVTEHMEVKPTELSSNSEAGLGQGQPTSSKAKGVGPKSRSEEHKQATIEENGQVSLECSLSDFIDMQVPPRKPSNGSDDKRVQLSQNDEVENDAINCQRMTSTMTRLRMTSTTVSNGSDDKRVQLSQKRHGQKWFEEKPVTIVFGDLVKKLAQPFLNRSMLQYLISKALVALSSKAILLWSVYNSEDIKQYFQCFAWVHVHKESEERDILEAILEQVTRNKEKDRRAEKSPSRLGLHDFLVRRRYLIVLYGALTDSVWSNLKSAFPFSFNGSRVILATQHSFGDSRKVQQQLLLEENAVVDDTAFKDSSEEWPRSFAYLGDDSSTASIKAAMSKLTRSIISPDRLLFLISIVGMERFGKSSLLWQIYDAKEVEQHFECRAWVHVQEDFKEIDVLVEIWKQISVREIKLSLEPMRQMVCNFLAQKRYLIVLCDVWTSSVWESLKVSLPNSLTGSRVILAVHNADIARQTNAWVFQMTTGKELLPDLKHLHEDALDQKVAQRWTSVSDIMENASEIIGMRDKIEELAKLALNSHRLHFLISVVGEAGSGKTTLVRAFYDSRATKQYFDCQAWITASQEREETGLLLDLLGQLLKTKQKQSLSIEQLRKRLHHFLNWRRYLIVLDDIQKPEIWKDKLIAALPNSSNGSRVILTTRKAYLAYHMNPPAVVLPLRPLNKDESRRLFLKKVQSTVGDDDVPSDLMQRCRGLPLAIVLLAGLLSNQQASSEAKNSDTDENPLIQSYNNLTFPLKHCLLYLGLFPTAYDIPVRRLILIWLAEGLIMQPERNTETPEELAMQQFVQLQKRNLVEIGKWRLDGSPKMCRLPNALHKELSKNAEKFGFFHVHQKPSNPTPSDPNTTKYDIPIRRLAEGLDMFIDTKHEKHCIQNLRSYISFYNIKGDRPADGIKNLINKLVKEGFVKLVVLDLEGVYKPALSETLGRLPCLKYLGVRRTHLDSIPKSVAELHHLQSLDVKHTNVITLPSTIWEAKKLEHLYMSEIYVDLSIKKPSDHEGSSGNLHTLWGLKIRGKIPYPSQLDRLTGVRKLKLTCYDSPMKDIDDWLSKLTNLQSLKLRSVSEQHESSELPMESMMKLHRLSKLYLLGKLTRPRETLSELPRSLTVLTLSGSYLSEDPMEILAELKELKVLRLYGHSFTGKTMACRNIFPKLLALKLWKLKELQHWVVEDGTMPVLENLEIRYCNQLQEVDGLKKVTTLTELTLTGMETSFVDYVKKIMGSDVKMEEKPLEVIFKRNKNPGENEISV